MPLRERRDSDLEGWEVGCRKDGKLELLTSLAAACGPVVKHLEEISGG